MSSESLRVLLRLAPTQRVYDATPDEHEQVKQALRQAFSNLSERFDVRVIGSMDDDLLAHGISQAPPYRGYILLDAPDLDTVARICLLMKTTTVGPHRLWRYVGIDARIGKRLPFIAES